MLQATFSKRRAYGKFASAALLALTFCMVHQASTAYAQTPAKYGSLKILSTPGGLPLEIDGRAEGTTTSDYRSFNRDPGLHTIVITLPDGQRWTREIDVRAGDVKCVLFDFRASPLVKVRAGEALTFISKILNSSDQAQLRYEWKVSNSEARILSGAGTPTITVDTTGLAPGPLTAFLTVSPLQLTKAKQCQSFAQASTIVLKDELPPIESVDVRSVEVGDLTGTVCDCGEIAVPVGEPSKSGKKKPRRPRP